MKLINFLLVLMLSFLLSAMAFAVAAEIPPTTDGALAAFFFENIFSAKEAGTVAISLLIAKTLLYAFNTPSAGKLLDKLTGKFKLVVTFLLTYLVAVLTSVVVKEISFGAAIVDSANIPLLGLLLNQIYKQFIQKAFEPSKADVEATFSIKD